MSGLIAGIAIGFQDSISWYPDAPVELINDEFDSYAGGWAKFIVGDADYELLEEDGISFLRLRANSGVENEIVLAQLDDHSYRPRLDNRWHPGTSLTVRMRFSHNQFAGTGGFYLWNNPAPIGASSWMEYRGMTWMGFQMISPTGTLDFGNGNLIRRGTVINKGMMQLLMIPAGLSNFEADEVDLTDFDMSQWHDYRIDWYPDHILLSIDDELVLESSETIDEALSFALWIDNTEITIDTSGEFLVANQILSSPVWIDVDYIHSEFLEHD